MSTETKPCGYPPCDVVLHRLPSDSPSSWNRRKTCSRQHGMLMRRPVLPDHKTCEECGKQYSRPRSASFSRWKTQRFCSRDCASLHTGGVNRVPETELEHKTCEFCGTEFVRNPTNHSSQRFAKRRFCSPEHAQEAARGGKPPKPKKKKAAPVKTEAKVARKTKVEPKPELKALPVFPGPQPTTVWRPASWGSRDIRPKVKTRDAQSMTRRAEFTVVSRCFPAN